jgi:DNA-binding NarL/FixJ family response regulator
MSIRKRISELRKSKFQIEHELAELKTSDYKTQLYEEKAKELDRLQPGFLKYWTKFGYVLTPRQCQVLTGVMLGLYNREIGERLFITEKSVKFHLGDVYKKFDVENRTQLALLINELMK